MTMLPPNPSWDVSFFPHPRTTPSADRASECAGPAATETQGTPCSSSTGAGSGCLRLPLPHRPNSPFPHDHTTPSRVSASMCDDPTETDCTRAFPSSASTRAGRGWDVLSPCPSPPFPPPTLPPPCQQGMCYTHTQACGGGAGLFLLLKVTKLLALRKTRATLLASPFVDAQGDDDQQLQR